MVKEIWSIYSEMPFTLVKCHHWRRYGLRWRALTISEISQSQKGKHHTTSFLGRLLKRAEQKKSREQNKGYQRPGRGREGEI